MTGPGKKDLAVLIWLWFVFVSGGEKGGRRRDKYIMAL